MHYIAIFTVYCNNAIVKAIEAAYTSAGADNAEDIINSLFKQSLLGLGLISDAAMIVYIGIVFQTIFYLIAYLNRMLKVGFLLVISPLITLTYAIDKMGDGKAQALSSWLKEYVYTILIQPFHCIIYFSFISVAFSLVNVSGDVEYSQIAAGLLAILCLKFINDGEKVVRKIFGFQDDNSKTSMAAGAVLGIAAVKSATKMAKSVKTGFNTGTAFASKFSQDLKKDMGNNATPLGKFANKVKESPLGDMAAGAKKGLDTAKNAVSDSGVGRTAKAGISGAKSLGGKLKNSRPGKGISAIKDKATEFAQSDRGQLAGRLVKAGARRSVDGAVAMLGFAATYATGDTDMLSAIGYGSAMKKGSDELLTSSASTNNEDARKTLEDATRYEKEEIDSKHEAYRYWQSAKIHLKTAERYANKAATYRQQSGSDAADKAKKYEEFAERERTRFAENIAMYKALEDNPDFLQHKDEKGDKNVAYTDEQLVNDKGIADAMKNREKAYQEKGKHLHTEKAVKARLDKMKKAPVDKNIKEEAKEIERLIRKITARRHMKAQSGHEIKGSDEIVTSEDEEFAHQLASVVDKNIQRDFLQHSRLEAKEMYHGFGLENLSRDHGSGEVDIEMRALLAQLENSVRRQQQNYAAKGIQGSRKTGQAMLGKGADSGLKDVVGKKFDEKLIKALSRGDSEE